MLVNPVKDDGTEDDKCIYNLYIMTSELDKTALIHSIMMILEHFTSTSRIYNQEQH